MPKIQLVDDDIATLQALQRVLHGSGLQLDAYSNVTEALAALQHTDYAVIIADYRMPQLDGVSYLEWARKKQPAASRIMLSAFPESAALQQAINCAEIFRFIAKPWRNNTLLRDVMLAVQRHQATEQDEFSRLLVHPLLKEQELQSLEQVEPGITQVDFDDDGAIILAVDNAQPATGEQ